MILSWLIGAAVGLLAFSGVTALLFWLHERRSERAAPRKLALIVMGLLLAGWTIATAFILLVAWVVTLLL